MKLKWEAIVDGVRIMEKRGLGSPRDVDRWNIQKPDLRRAVARLRDIANCDDQAVQFRSTELFLSHRCISELPERDARALGLPPACPFALRLECRDEIKSPHFRVKAHWVKSGGRPVRVDQTGAFLKNAGVSYRVPQPHFDIAEQASILSVELGEDEREAAYGTLVRLLRQHIDTSIQADKYLNQVTIYHATAFSLRLGVNDNDLDFDPILFGRDIVDDVSDGALVDETAASLLSPRHQRIFATDRFRRYREARRAYPLEDGSFVVLEPDLLAAMKVVRRAASADSATRKQFITNPTGFIKANVAQESHVDIDGLFIETEQFSDRVTGIDVWRKPVTPWIKSTPETWIPERFGVRVGGRDPIEIPPNQIEDILKAYDGTAQAGNGIFSWEGHTFPVNKTTREAFANLAALQLESYRAQQALPGLSKKHAPSETIKHFLTVAENLDVVGYEKPFLSEQGSETPPQLPGSVKARLKSYQKQGFEWLVRSFTAGMPGVLLADDMGLGKTLQTLAYLTWVRETSPVHAAPVLIVAPTGLLENWKAEIQKHLQPDTLGVVVKAYGRALGLMRYDADRGTETLLGRTVLDTRDWEAAGIVLTTYETMRDYHFSFAKIRFGAIVFDEVQKLKNPTSQMSRTARTLNSGFKIGLSGTPVENQLQDLWSIMDVLWPGFLGSSRDFEKQFPATSPDKLEQLHGIIFNDANGRPAVGLRRLKASELDGLPAKEEKKLLQPMSEVQARAYASVVRSAITARSSMSPGDGMLKTLQDLKSVCLHPEPPETGYADMAAYINKSARLIVTVDTLKQIQSKREKALVFVENLEMQSFLAEYIQQKFGLARRPECISGKVPGRKRQQIVDRFQSGPSGFGVLILSPKAGGVGLTITAANHVIHLSRWWNPAVEDQSTDRVFRIGQNKDVTVYLPIACWADGASFDEKLDDLLRKKRSLAGKMLMPPEDRDADASALFDQLTQAPVASETSDFPDGHQTRMATEDEPTVHVEGVRGQEPVMTRTYTYKEGQKPCYRALFGDLEGVQIKHLKLIDPYSMWRSDGQTALCRLIFELSKRANTLEKVELVSKPPNQVEDREFETFQDALHRLRTNVACQMNQSKLSNPERIFYTERRKTKKQDFHDRSFTIHFEHNGKMFNREYLVSRGLDAFERFDWSMDITVKPDDVDRPRL